MDFLTSGTCCRPSVCCWNGKQWNSVRLELLHGRAGTRKHILCSSRYFSISLEWLQKYIFVKWKMVKCRIVVEKKNNPVPSKDLVRNKIKGSHGTFFMEDFCWISHQSCCLFCLWHGLFWIKAHHKGTLVCQKFKRKLWL